ncbi:MAG: HD domain-containing protein [SAR324 cluster bacterium]|nr:HD domain-containing protein [SAR324 cluster bacterium]
MKDEQKRYKRLANSSIKGKSKQEKFKRLTLALKAQNVKRWHTVETTENNSVGLHSARVIEILFFLYDYLSLAPLRAELIMAALRHDYAEVCFGDVPHHAATKEIKSLINKQENIWLINNYFNEPILTIEKDMLYLADKLEALMFCLRELAKGNILMEKIAQTSFKGLDEQAYKALKRHGLDVSQIINQLKIEHQEIKDGHISTDILVDLIKQIPPSEQLLIKQAVNDL